MRRAISLFCFLLIGLMPGCRSSEERQPTLNPIRSLQIEGVRDNRRDVVRWGPDTERYASWDSHTNRLIPVYTFGTRDGGVGVDLEEYQAENSVYRDAERLMQLYGREPSDTLNAGAEYFDQTDIFRIQRQAAEAGKRHIFLVVFDGMDWQTTRAAAVYRSGEVRYETGRGSGLHLLDYDAGGSSQYGFAVTAPADNRTSGDPDRQTVEDDGSGSFGGYDAGRGGPTPWQTGSDPSYVIGKAREGEERHPYADSASTGTALCSGIKTYNGAINVDPRGELRETIAHHLQRAGWAIGVVTSVPISHATPATAYAHNVTRRDYQDLTRDMLGLPSISNPESPLDGVDVLIGCGHSAETDEDRGQGENFVPGNRYLTDEDLSSARARYVVAQRTAGVDGGTGLAAAASRAAADGRRLLGFYGAGGAHLPYQTADGAYDRVVGEAGEVESYSNADVRENPTLAQMTEAALKVLSAGGKNLWMMVEAGDVDWANHGNNIDDSIGAVLAGDDAVRAITDWVEANSDWDESLLIVTADHGHYLVLVDPQGLTSAGRDINGSAASRRR